MSRTIGALIVICVVLSFLLGYSTSPTVVVHCPAHTSASLADPVEPCSTDTECRCEVECLE